MSTGRRLRTRLALRAALPAAAALLLVAGVVETVLVGPMERARDELLRSRVEGLRTLAEEGGLEAFRRRGEAWTRAGEREWALLRRGGPGPGGVLATAGRAPPPGADALKPAVKGPAGPVTVPDAVDGAWRVLVVPVAEGAGGPSLVLAAGVSLEEVLQSRREVRLLLAGAALAGVILVAAGAWSGAAAVLDPLRGMTEAARAVDAERPAGGLSAGAAKDEFGDLARLLDGLLARVGRSLEEERRFAGEAAHEMRGPLSVLRIRVEEALASGDAGEREEALRSVLADVDRIDRLVQALLEMARALPSGEAPPPPPLDVGAVLGALAPDFATLGEARGVAFRWTPPAGPRAAAAPRAGLDTAAWVLGDNAFRYTPRGGSAAMTVEESGGRVAVLVRDTGPGVSAEEGERIFDRLFRGRAGRSSGAGFGLGLALARRLARSCGGEVDLLNPGEPGALFRLSVPGTSASS